MCRPMGRREIWSPGAATARPVLDSPHSGPRDQPGGTGRRETPMPEHACGRMNRRAFLETGATTLGATVFPSFRPSVIPSFRLSVPDERLDWWRHARFGLFLHWGLYSILTGEWGGRDDYAEWIRNSAHIPLAEYD